MPLDGDDLPTGDLPTGDWAEPPTQALLVPLLIPRVPWKTLNAILFFGVFPVAAFYLLVGGRFGLSYVETRLWGGLLVTLVITFAGIIGSVIGAVIVLLLWTRVGQRRSLGR